LDSLAWTGYYSGRLLWPVTDNAQSIYELSLIENEPDIKENIKKTLAFTNFKNAKEYLEQNDGVGNTFKATAKPVLIGTAVTGATTLIFSIIVLLTNGLTQEWRSSPFFTLLFFSPDYRWRYHLLVHWCINPGCECRRLQGSGIYKSKHKAFRRGDRASMKDSKRVVEICTQYAQKGMFNIFLTVFFATLAFACLEPYFFIGYLISIAIFGLYQAIFMANAGGAWDNAKKLVETELNAKARPSTMQL